MIDFIFYFLTGWMIGDLILGIIDKRKKLKDESEVESKDDPDVITALPAKSEYIDGSFYLYNKITGEFLAQGEDEMKVAENMRLSPTTRRQSFYIKKNSTGETIVLCYPDYIPTYNNNSRSQ